MRVATYNIRNVRALDWASLWWRRRGRLSEVISSIPVDVWGMQEAYRSQIDWLAAHALPADEWDVAGEGRKTGGGESVPLWHRTATLRRVADETRWFGPTPDVPGSKIAGAQFPRIATIARYELVEDGAGIVVANVHLDSASVANRTTSLEQIVEWLADEIADTPTIVLGDFNAPTSEPGFAALTDAGLRSALPSAAGPTSNGFGRDLEHQMQIDHVFVSPHFEVRNAEIHTTAGYASDHYPVVVDLALAGA